MNWSSIGAEPIEAYRLEEQQHTPFEAGHMPFEEQHTQPSVAQHTSFEEQQHIRPFAEHMQQVLHTASSEELHKPLA